MISVTPDGQIIALVSVGVAIMSSLVRMATLDMKKMREMKEKIKEHQKTLKEATKSSDIKGAKRAQEELMRLTIENMKHSFRPMIITFVPFILIFYWLREQYGSAGVVASISGFGLDWLGWYIICSIISSIILNKLLKLS